MGVRRYDLRQGYWSNGQFVPEHKLAFNIPRAITDDDLRAIQAVAVKKPEFFGGKKMKTLYRYTVNGNEVIGERLAIDGSRWVMKRMDTAGTVEVVSPRLCSEVLPYTVGVRFDGEGAVVYHYFGVEGSVAVGDLLWLRDTSGFAEVAEVDSKSKKATKALVGWKVASSKLPTVDN